MNINNKIIPGAFSQRVVDFVSVGVVVKLRTISLFQRATSIAW